MTRNASSFSGIGLFIHGWWRHSWDRVQGCPSPDGWIFRTAFNELKRRGRRRDLEQVLLKKATGAGPVPIERQPEIWQLVADLPHRQRQAVALRHVAHLTEPEVADVMGCRRGTVSSHLRAAYRTLRLELQDQTTPEQGLTTHVHDA